MTKKRAIEVLRVRFLGDSYEVIDAKNKAIESLKQTEWIPVTERLPEKTGLYLTSIGDLVTTMSFDGHTFSAWGQPIAWMPLPQPYKEGEEE